MSLVKWVAKLSCGHIVSDATVVLPTGLLWCAEHQDGYAIDGLVTDLPERDRAGKAW